MIVVGLLVTFSQFATRIEAGRLEEAQRALLYPLTDMLIFPVFFGAAIAYRKKSEIHKRRMVHPVYVIGVIVLAVSGFRDSLRSTEIWLELTNGLTRLVT